jgi:adenylate cyclase
MQHKDRELFLAELERIIGEAGTDANPAPLRRRIAGLLDDFLLESQPIAGTNATILLADIRGFTALSESLPPATVIRSLNRYFATMSCIVRRHGGVIDKFIGDSVMALFGVPQNHPDDVLRALACAVEMQQAMVELNLEAEARGEPRLYAGIAVNSGPVMAGSFGSRDHNEFTVIGDAVNLASRMEAFSLRGQVLVSEGTVAAVRDRIRIARRIQVRVKGRSKPLHLYEVRAVTHHQRLVVPRVELRRSPRVEVELPVVVRPLEGKRLLPAQLPGRTLNLGYNGMRVALPVTLAPCADVSLSMGAGLGAPAVEDLDAKVVSSIPNGSGFELALQFTCIDTPAHGQLKQYVDSLLWGR